MRHRGDRRSHLTTIQQQQEHASCHHRHPYPSPRRVTPRFPRAPTQVSVPKASCTHQWYPSAATPTREQESGFKHASSSEAQNTAPVGGGAASAHRHLSIALDKLSSSKSATAAHMSPPLEPAVSYRDRNKILKSPLYSDFTW